MTVKIVTTDEDGSISVSPVPGYELCDFCNTSLHGQPIRDYKAVDFQMYDSPPVVEPVPIPNWSRGDWAACAECARLIDAGEWEALAEHSVRSIYPEGHTEANKDALRRVQQRFRIARDEYARLH